METISKELEELIPMFMTNTLREVDEMVQALEEKDWPTLVRLGHSTKGAAYGYGFDRLGEIGLRLEDTAKTKNENAVRVLLNELKEYLDKVQISYE